MERTKIRTAQKAGPLSPEGQKFEKQLQSGELNPLTTLNKDLDENRATVESIRLCLHQVMADFEKIPRKMRVAEANKAPDGIVERLLAHIWSSDKLALAVSSGDGRKGARRLVLFGNSSWPRGVHLGMDQSRCRNWACSIPQR